MKQHPSAKEITPDRDAPARLVPVFEFVDALAALYADLWFDGKLDQIRKESIDDEDGA